MSNSPKYVNVPETLLKKKFVIYFFAAIIIPYILWGIFDYIMTIKSRHEAASYFYAKDYTKAYEAIMQHAQDGDAESRYQMGVMVAMGLGTPRDTMRAAYWFSCNGISGCVTGQGEYRLAESCFSGEWGKKREDECLIWMKLSANNGYQPASVWLDAHNKSKTK